MLHSVNGSLYTSGIAVFLGHLAVANCGSADFNEKKSTSTDLESGVTIIFAPPPANVRYGLAVLVHNSGHFWPPLPFWALGPPALPGLPMASYALGASIGLLRCILRYDTIRDAILTLHFILFSSA